MKKFITNNKNSLLCIIKRLIFTLIIFLSFTLQFKLLAFSLPFPVYLLIPAVIGITMHEKEAAGIFFGLLSGILWDITSPATDGLMALTFTVGAFITSFLVKYILRNTLLNGILLNLIFSFIYSVSALLLHTDSFSFEFLRDIFIKNYLPAIIFTAALSIPYYLSGRYLSRKFKEKEQQL